MGRLFEVDGCQYELFASGGQGVSCVNLTTSNRIFLASKEDIPEQWPQDIKDSLQDVQFVRHDFCAICLQPQTPLCGCRMDTYDMWCVPRVLEQIDPPPEIDDMSHLMHQAEKTMELACVADSSSHRKTLISKAIELVNGFMQRQRTVTQATVAHYVTSAGILRNYAKACYNEISALREHQKVAFVNHRKDFLEEVSGRRTCQSCQEDLPCYIARPCMHASMCRGCWDQWVKTKNESNAAAVCPVCRAHVTSIVLPMSWNNVHFE